MKLYLASSIRNMDMVKEVGALLESFGHKITCDWCAFSADTIAFSQQYRQFCIDDMFRGIDEADALVLIFPIGRGAHIEIGYAVAKEKRIIILSNKVEDEVLFYNDSRIEWVADSHKLLRVIDNA